MNKFYKFKTFHGWLKVFVLLVLLSWQNKTFAQTMVGSVGNSLYSIDMNTGFYTLLTTNYNISGTIESIGHDPVRNRIYYIQDVGLIGNNFALYAYDIATKTHIVVEPDMRTKGLKNAAFGTSFSCGDFYNGSYYLKIDRPDGYATAYDEVFKIDFNAYGGVSTISSLFKTNLAGVTTAGANPTSYTGMDIHNNLIYLVNSDTKVRSVAAYHISGVLVNNYDIGEYHMAASDNSGNFWVGTGYRVQKINPISGVSIGLPQQLAINLNSLEFVANDAFNPLTRNKYRSIDGTLNNTQKPNFGASGIPLFRELNAEYSDGLNALAGANRPTPRLISNKLSHEEEDDHNDRDMAGLFYIWGQFIDHDITLTPNGTEKAPISLPSDEKIFSSPIPFTRSAIHSGTGVTTPRDQTNLQTSWIDGSHIYGWNMQIANWLRTFQGGKLKVSTGNMLPFNTFTGEYGSAIDPNAPKMDDDNGRTKKTFAAGDPRAAEHPGLTSLHTLFVREHNKICDRLRSQNPTLSDEETYQKARKEIGALIQHITYTQWTTALGVQLQPYAGYNPNVRPDIGNIFSTAAYRWHTMVENDIIFRDNNCRGVGPSELPLKDVFFNIEIVRKYDIGVILKGLSVHRQYETDLKVNSGLRNFLFGPGAGLDLVSLNIQRGRDHGLPNYNTIRAFYTGSSAYSFNEIAAHDTTAQKMQALYGNVNNVDAWVGLYAEPRLYGKSVGKTVDAIFRSQFEKLRDGDYYFYQNDPELTPIFSSIAATKLKDIIARNSTANNFQDNVFFRKSCSSSGDDIAHYNCGENPTFDGWTYIGQTGAKKYYKWNGANANFSDAKGLVQRLGGHLPQINNLTENTALKNALAGNKTWLDLNKIGTQWKYSNTFNASDILVNGIVSPYYNWNTYQPDNIGGIETRAEIDATGRWNDVAPTILLPVVAEVPCQSDCAADVTPPTFTYCPPSQSIQMSSYEYCKYVSWATPVATDNCGAVSVVQTVGPPNNSCLYRGYNYITYTATDAKGNKRACGFTLYLYTGSLFSQSNANLTIDAHAEPTRSTIEWVSNTGSKNDFFTLEKANNATGVFEKLQVINNTNFEDKPAHFIAYDNAPTEGDNIYRVKVTHNDGSIKISETKTVNFKGLSEIRAFPNPANDIISLDLTNYKNETVEIYLYNYLGQPVLFKKVDNLTGVLLDIDIANQPVGNYMIRVKSKDKRDATKSVIITR